MTDKETLESLQILVMSFQMQEYKERLVKRLNTGQKRKLQLAIALIGDPKVDHNIGGPYHNDGRA